jgi:hypothetical protein
VRTAGHASKANSARPIQRRVRRAANDRHYRGTTISENSHSERPLLLCLALVGAITSGLLVGYEPVGGDSDRIHRPIKTELARALHEGKLPFWSDRFGLGVPLVAESQVAAFYPPNLVLYFSLDVSTAYRLAMWLHYLGLVAATYFYARSLGLAPWSAALTALSFTLCGFQSIHSSNECFYVALPYLPLALGLAERFLSTGRLVWLAALSLTLGVQWTLGHFQLQTWTNGLVLLTGLWRMATDRQPWWRLVGIFGAVAWGVAIGAVQLGLSWQLAALVGQTRRPVGDLMYYSYPPSHWFEMALPQLIRGLRLGPDDPYWFSRQTTGYEACFYAGTIPLTFVLIGLARPAGRSTQLWRMIVPLSFAVATMPQWWPAGYLELLSVPGIGYFRAPARYTVLTSLGLAVLAGEGFDRAVSRSNVRFGFLASIVFAGCAAIAGCFWSMRPDVHLHATFAGIPDGFLWAALAWSVAWVIVWVWQSSGLVSWPVLVATALELGCLYYAGTTQWGWAVAVPGQSAALRELADRSPANLIGGEIENMPVRIGLVAGNPYISFLPPRPGDLLRRLQQPPLQTEAAPEREDDWRTEVRRRWLRRFRVSYLVTRRPEWRSLGNEVGRWTDPDLDRLVRREPEPADRQWSIIELDEPFPEARVAAKARTAPDRRSLVNRLSESDEADVAWFLAEDHIAERPDARIARLVEWDGATATVEHDAACDLVIARTFDTGWHAQIDGGRLQPMTSVDGGFISVRLEGSGTHRVAIRYRPRGFVVWLGITSIAAGLNLVSLAVLVWHWLRQRLMRQGKTVAEPL